MPTLRRYITHTTDVAYGFIQTWQCIYITSHNACIWQLVCERERCSWEVIHKETKVVSILSQAASATGFRTFCHWSLNDHREREAQTIFLTIHWYIFHKFLWNWDPHLIPVNSHAVCKALCWIFIIESVECGCHKYKNIETECRSDDYCGCTRCFCCYFCPTQQEKK